MIFLQLHVFGRHFPRILEVVWYPPPLDWLKVNIDGEAFGSLGLAVCKGVFGSYISFVKGCFAIPPCVCFVFLG